MIIITSKGNNSKYIVKYTIKIYIYIYIYIYILYIEFNLDEVVKL